MYGLMDFKLSTYALFMIELSTYIEIYIFFNLFEIMRIH